MISVLAAFFASGGLNAGTPLAIASTPVSATDPPANALSSSRRVKTWVPGCWYWRDGRYVVRHGYWLTPEPRAYWDSGDSIVGEYANYCDEVVECRTLRQLERFVP